MSNNIDDFLAARYASQQKNTYMVKQKKNETAYNFVEQYLNDSGKLTYKLQEEAYRYQMAKRTILAYEMPSNFPKITQEVIDNIFIQIKEHALQNFIKFFDSYINRLKENGVDYKTRVENSLNDLKIAYSTYRKINIKGWNTPREQISVVEMENLYNILTNSKPSQDVSNCDVPR